MMKKKYPLLRIIPVFLYLSTIGLDHVLHWKTFDLGTIPTVLMIGLIGGMFGVAYGTAAFVAFLFANGTNRQLDIIMMLMVIVCCVISFATGYAGMMILGIEGAAGPEGWMLNTFFGICYVVASVAITIRNFMR
ncbi:hypothetical protein [Butyrivibrio sp. WCD2001]|uniref:hypothetical protein n=1 Tax=Butyrivibrio sp. WCD2001 TaxID=1280681 RepID=UPI0012DDA2CB|nr:hypothetical protein [Butyrivibrio sp. WCD2001]